MDTIEIARIIHHEVTDANSEIFKERYFGIDPSLMREDGFRDEAIFCQGLKEKDKALIARIIRQVSVDTASTILGLVEGSTTSEQMDGEFFLIYEGVEVGRDIQTEFLILEQERFAQPR